ncbi:MAG: proton-conducting transporter membrane subunit [Pseudomonadota bacterium]
MQLWLDVARAHAPLLMIVFPFAAAALALASPSARVAWIVAMLGALCATASGADLCWRMFVLGLNPPAAAEGVALDVTGAGAFCATVLAGVSTLALCAAGQVTRDVRRRAAPMVFALASSAAGGWIAALFARDVAAIFVASEIAWLAGVALLGATANEGRGALNGALRMLTMGGAASAFMLLGVGLLERGMGGSALALLYNDTIAAPRLAGVGAGLMIIALAFKTGLTPLQTWLGPAFSRAGASATLIVGVIGLSGALCVLVRLGEAAVAAPVIGDGVAAALGVVAAATLVAGSIQAMGAHNLRRLIAYAGAAQAGGALIGVALGSPAGLAASLEQIVVQCASLLALFGAAALTGERASLESLDGLGRRAPLASAALALGMLGLMGAPLSTGFLARWRLIEAGFGGGWWWTAGALIGASLAAVIFGGRILERIYFRRATQAVVKASDPWRFARAPALVVAIVVLLWGVEPSALLRLADAAAQLDLGEGS